MIKSSECISFTLSQTYYDYGCWLWFKQELPHILPKISLKRKAKKNSLKLNRLKKKKKRKKFVQYSLKKPFILSALTMKKKTKNKKQLSI